MATCVAIICETPDSEHRAQKRITNAITGLVWMVLAGVIVSTITAIAVAYGLIEQPF
jgi:predicted benzoate:H+ symporter BenE